MKDEECGQEKFYFIEKLVSELHEMQDQLRDREKIKVEYEKEMSQRIRIEEESHKIRTSLEEQLAERGAEMDRMTADRERILQEWTQMLDNLRDRLINSKF